MIRFVLCCLFGLLPHTIAAQDITPLTRPTLFLLFDSSGSAHGINATGSTSAGARDFFWTGVKLALQQDEIVNRLVSCQYDLRSLAWSDAEPHILSSERARSADDVALFVATTDTNMREAANALGNGTSPSTGLTAVTNELLRDEGVVPVVLLLYDGSGYTQSSFDAGLREEIARRGGSIHLIGYPFQGVSDLKSLADDVATPPTDAVVAVPMVSAEYPDIIAHILRFACQFHGA